MGILRPPAQSLLDAASRIDDAIGGLTSARRHASGHWEALDEADAMLLLVVRHCEGVLELARIDEVLLPAAWAAARSAIEIAVRLRWLVEPAEPYEREARWLARVAEEERYWRAIAKETTAGGGDASTFEQTANNFRDFRSGVTAKLPAGIVVEERIPSVARLMARDQGVHRLYRDASQYVHGTHAGGVLYRRNLGTAKELGELVRTRMWAAPLASAWWGLTTATTSFINAVGGTPWPSSQLSEAVRVALIAVDTESTP